MPTAATGAGSRSRMDPLARGASRQGSQLAPLPADRCYDLAVHHDPAQGAVVLEYAFAGKVVATGAPYGNRYISVITLRDREVVHWRDYLDPIAVFDALGWPPH
jgi:ketosteroid isomerase-like protein